MDGDQVQQDGRSHTTWNAAPLVGLAEQTAQEFHRVVGGDTKTGGRTILLPEPALEELRMLREPGVLAGPLGQLAHVRSSLPYRPKSSGPLVTKCLRKGAKRAVTERICWRVRVY